MADDLATQSALTPALASLAEKYQQDNDGDDANAQAIVEAIAQDIMDADTVDAVLDGGATTAVEDILDEPLTIRGFVLRKADDEYADALPFFAVVDAVRQLDGEVLVVTTGAYNILVALRKIDLLGGFPVMNVAFRQAGRALRLYRSGTKTFEA